MAKDNLTVRLEDTDPIFRNDKKGAPRANELRLEDVDPIFKDTLPVPSSTSTSAPPPPAELSNLQNLPASYQMARRAIFGESPISPGVGEFGGAILGGTAGMLEQGRNILNLRPGIKAMGEAITAPPPSAATGSAYEKWLRNFAGLERTGPGGVPEAAQTYQRTKTHGEAGKKVYQRYGNQPLDINRYLAATDEADRARKLAWLKQAGEKTTRGLGYVPGLSVLAGGLGGADLIEALRRLERGEYGGAAIKGIGGLGALASLLPFPLTRLGGGALSLLSMPAEALYQGGEPPPPSAEYEAP